MRKPSKSIDEFIVSPAPIVTPEPPHEVSLRRTGEVEVLKPLTPLEVNTEPARTAFKTFRAPQPLWFRRFLAVGSGALVMIALVLVTAILVGINDPAAGPDIAADVTSTDELTQPEEPFSFDVYSPSTFAPATGGSRSLRSNPRRRPIRRSVRLAATKPEQPLRPSLQPEEPDFVPTTLVIYAENGVINTRIEPWLQDSY